MKLALTAAMLLLLFALCWAQQSAAQAGTDDNAADNAEGQEERDYPAFGDEDVVELYHLQSQFLVNDTQQYGVPFLMSSTGLAFRSTRTSKVLTMEYGPGAYKHCLLPRADETGVKWACGAVMRFREEVDPRRWKHSTYLTHVSGFVYNRFVRWAAAYANRFPRYGAMAICSPEQSSTMAAFGTSRGAKDFTKCYSESSTHEDFIARAFVFLASWGVQLRPLLVPQQTRVIIVAQKEPKVVWYNDLAYQADIVHFYNNLIDCTKEGLKDRMENASEGSTASLEDVVQALATCRAVAGYVVINDQEYYYVNTVEPYAQLISVPQPIPDAQTPVDPGGDAVDWLLLIVIIAVFLGGVYFTYRRLEGKPCLDPDDGEDVYEGVGPRRRRKRRRRYEWMPQWLFHMLSHNEPHVHDPYANGTYYEMSSQVSQPTTPRQSKSTPAQYTDLPLIDVDDKSNGEENVASV